MPLPFDHSGAGTVTFKAPASGTWTFTLPTGAGSAGQVLTTDGSGNLSWATAGGGGGGSGTVTSVAAGTGLSGGTITTTGTIALDINSLTGAVPVAADTVPIYDASATAIRKAGAAEIASLAAGNSGYRSGETYGPWGTTATTNTAPLTAGRVYYVPFICGRKTTFTGFVYEVTTASTATANARLGIYNAADGIPTSKVMETALSSGVNSVAVATVTISQSLEAGFYFLAFITDGDPYVRQVSPNLQMNNFLMGSSSATAVTTLGYTETSSGTTLPSTAGTLTRQTAAVNLLGMWLKA